MVQLVEITNVCDRCYGAEGERVEAVEAVEVSFESGTYSVDLCARHAEEFRRFESWVEEVGRRSGGKKRTRKQPKSENPCPVCDRVFDTPQGLSMHKTQTHSASVRCDVCGREFGSAISMTNHRRAHRRRADQAVACPECGAEYANRAGLATHRRNAHPAAGGVGDQEVETGPAGDAALMPSTVG